MYPRPRKRLEERIEMTQMHFDYKHYYPRLLKQPIVKLTPTEQKKQSKTTMRSFVATRKQKRGW